MRVTFADRFVDDETVYERGNTYDINSDRARHLLTRGKVRVAEETKKRVAKPAKSINAEVHKDSATDK